MAARRIGKTKRESERKEERKKKERGENAPHALKRSTLAKSAATRGGLLTTQWRGKRGEEGGSERVTMDNGWRKKNKARRGRNRQLHRKEAKRWSCSRGAAAAVLL